MLRTASRSCSWGVLSLVSLLLLLSLARHHQADAASMYRTASDSHVQRLCSSNLSDALFLLCKGRGFNGPFSNSGEVSSSDSKSGGLVDECCIQSCTLEQMEQYCMPPPPSKTD
ncbi:insulin-like growth factor I [Copidosoma floridanum]|uniref:insulin-like growth factor I n=1 Tax=Copidosoma floridanum TaxID=29053 RepID=UPI000C6F79D7|nr:insulin-like growth factor I [Copidosoma floridanum]